MRSLTSISSENSENAELSGHSAPPDPCPPSQQMSLRPGSPVRPPTGTFNSYANSAASSTFNLNSPEYESTVNLLQYPQRAYHQRSPSATSLSSYYGGDTACATPHEKVSFEADRNLSPPEQSRFSRSVSSFDKQLDPSSYHIETLHQHDDVEFLPSWKRKLYRLSPVFTFLAVAAYFLYYAYRIHCTVVAQEAFDKTYVMAWLFIAAEGCVTCEYHSTLIHYHSLTNNRSCSPPPTLSNALDSWSLPSQVTTSRKRCSNGRCLRDLLWRRCGHRT